MINFYEEALKRKDDLLKDLITLVKIPSVDDPLTATENQPFGGANREALDAMLAIGKRDGYEVDEVDGYAGHIDIGDKEETFGVLGHLDVVPCNEVGWNTNPYDPVINNGVIYGRGVADDKGPLLAGYYAAKIIDELKLPVKMKTRVIFGCNEEKGSGCVKHYFTKRPYPAMGFTPDGAFPVVYGEKAMSGMKLKGTFEKDNIIGLYAGTVSNIVPEVCEAIVAGNYKQYKDSFNTYLKDNHLTGSIEEEGNHTKLTLVGKSAHASTPEEGINAATYMCHYLATVSNNKLVHFVDKCLHQSYNAENLNVGFVGKMGPVTVNLGILKYKDENANITLDFRLPHEVTENYLIEHITPVLSEYGLNETHSYTQGLYFDPESHFVQTLYHAYVEITGDHEHKPETMGGGTYAKSMPNCVAFGASIPGKEYKMHQNNEQIEIEDLVKATAIYAKAIYELIKE